MRPGGRPNGASILFRGSSSTHWSGRCRAGVARPGVAGNAGRAARIRPAEGVYDSLTHGAADRPRPSFAVVVPRERFFTARRVSVSHLKILQVTAEADTLT